LNYDTEEFILHRYAEKTDSPIPTIVEPVTTGILTVSYTRLNKPETKKINVNIEVRECSAFSKGKWVESSPGVWTLAP
jgi:hypothetical protein